MAKKKEYGNDSITMLEGAARVRTRPAVIFGSDGLEGCEHAVFEIITNSVDEARAGFGSRIIVTRFLDGSYEVQDYGRGIPVDYNAKYDRYNWELVFCELYAGSKYDNDDDSAYKYSLGMNGLGLCSTQYASEFMDAEIKTKGFRYELHFEKGENVGGLKKEEYTKKETGTRIRWKPDADVFSEIDVPLSYFRQIMEKQAVVNKGVRLILKNETANNKFETFEYYYEGGIVEYLNRYAEGAMLTPIQYWEATKRGRDQENRKEYEVLITCAISFSAQKTLKEYYHNSSFLELGGSPEKAVRAAFVYQIDAYMKQNGKYNKSDSRIMFQDIEDCLLIVVSSFSSQASFENQTKKAVNNKFIQDAMTEFFKHQLEVYFLENKLDADKICERVLINMRSRVRAEAARLDVQKKLSGGKDMLNRIEKFADCRSKNVDEREIFIVEGDSALGACKQARDSAFQAVMPVRGKILNCLKADLTKVFKSEIITDLIKILGCGVEVSGKAVKGVPAFNIDNLRWNKVIICTDADYDGFQIRTLILTMIYTLMPTLIDEGKVYIAESPLYEITCGKDTYFAYTEKEKTDALAEIGDKKYTIQRSKGLGENEPEMMWLTTMNPATRRLIKVEPDYDPAAVADMFDLLLGDNLQGRKEHIAKTGNAYMDLVDLS